MNTKQTLDALRLILGAAQADAEKCEIAPEFIPQISQARADVELMRGTDVINALLMHQRSGISLAHDVRQRVRIDNEKSQRPHGLR